MAGKQSGLGDNFMIGGFDLSGDVSALSQISGGPAAGDVTPVNSYGNQRIGLLRSGDMQFTTFFEFSGPAGSAPSFPLTTVPYTSTFPVPVLVTITGGTVTEVAVNGVSTLTGDGTVLVPPLGSITVTYTGSPSWTWTLQGTEHDILSVLPRTDAIASYFRGTTLLNPCASIMGRQLNYDPTRDATGNLTMAVEVQSDGYGLEWGVRAEFRHDPAPTWTTTGRPAPTARRRTCSWWSSPARAWTSRSSTAQPAAAASRP